MRKHFSAGAATAALVVGLALVAACAPPPSGPGTTPTTTTSPSTTSTTLVPSVLIIKGRVVDSVTGVPVAGVEVLSLNLSELTVPSGPTVGSDFTDADGKFQISGGPPSAFNLFAKGPAGYTPLGDVDCAPGFLFVGNTPACTLVNPDVGDIRIDYLLDRTFFGQLFDASSSAALEGVKVTLTDLVGTPLDPPLVAFTDSFGKFGFTVPNALDDFGVLVDGSGQGFETGYLSCAPGYPNGQKKVVATWVEACSWGPLSLGTIGLDAL